MEGKEERITPGHALSMDDSRPFTSLGHFGTNFLNKLKCSDVVVDDPRSLLKRCIFVDTPGVLSGEKQTLGRNYAYDEVIQWFAARSDRILLMFDANKLDIRSVSSC